MLVWDHIRICEDNTQYAPPVNGTPVVEACRLLHEGRYKEKYYARLSDVTTNYRQMQ
jgi:hypothetical protein